MRCSFTGFRRRTTVLASGGAIAAGLALIPIETTAQASSSPSTHSAPASPSAVVPGETFSPLVTGLLRAMTLDEKLGMLSGWPLGQLESRPKTDRLIGVGWMQGVPRLGVPGMTFTDGPAGVRVNEPTTALPAPVSLAATFSPELARQYGTVMGREARARDQDVLFAPMLNSVRVPLAGRNFETLGEDPYLTSLLGTAEIKGIQSQGTMATAKHFAANQQETDRYTVDTRVDERTLNEIELRGFESAIAEGRPGSVMCAYPKVNGTYACENTTLLQDVLRERWRFSGFVVSDYLANHSGAPALKAGLDLEFITPYFLTLKPQVQLGLIPQREVDRSAGRILTSMERFGLLAHASPSAGTVVPRPSPSFDAAGGAAAARRLATEGSVLLRNSGTVLPLDAASRRSVALIGATGRHPLVGGGGSSRVMGAADQIGALDALRADGARVDYAVGRDIVGTTIPASALRVPFSNRPGLLRTGAGAAPTEDRLVDAVGSRALPEGKLVTWTGDLVAPETGDYTLTVQTKGAYGAIFVDGKYVAFLGHNGQTSQLLTNLRTTPDGLDVAPGSVRLTEGRHAIQVVATPSPDFGVIDGTSGPVQVRLGWVTPSQRRADLAEAVSKARRARVAVVYAHVEGLEGSDLTSLRLPDGQDELIEAVAAANPRTVVVLNSGYPVLMPWLNKVAAVLDVWYPGQEGGEAAADMLLGRAAPGGRLPVSFPAREGDTAVGGQPSRFPGQDGRVTYSEGVFTGYRWYDHTGVAPLFPFGFGLSYTTFGFGDLAVQRTGGSAARAQVTVTNTGSRSGTAVPQVYAQPSGPGAAPVPLPVRQLAGTERVTLRPGESRRVTISLDAKSWSYWDVRTHRWVAFSGPVQLRAGSSSRDLPLSAALS